MSHARPSGPVEDGAWPTTLEAHVVDPGPPVRIHGYDAREDLARHHSPAEITLLTYTGELPDARAVRLYEFAVALLAPVAITAASAHAAVLARLLAAPDANVVAIAATLAAEHAEQLVGDHARWLAWCVEPSGDPPGEAVARPDDDAARLARAALEGMGIELGAILGARPSTTATALALLQAAGIRDGLHMIAIVVQAGLPCIIAEAQRHTPRRLAEYPIAVPAFDYTEDHPEGNDV